MSSYYHFHKQQANEQVQARLQEAESHRLSKQGNGRSSLAFLLKLTLPLLVGVAGAVLLLTSCTPGDARAEDSASRASATSKVTMAERIHFQDAREISFEVDQENPNVEEMTMGERIHFQDTREASFEVDQEDLNAEEMTMAARILFQDKRDLGFIEEQVVEPSTDWTMAERLQFHDRIQEQYP